MFSIDPDRESRVKRYIEWIYKKQPLRQHTYMIELGITYFNQWQIVGREQYLEEMEDCFQVAEQMMRDGK